MRQAVPTKPSHWLDSNRRPRLAQGLVIGMTVILSLHLHAVEAFCVTMTCQYRVSDGVRPEEACPPWRPTVFGDTLLTRDFLVISTAGPKQSVTYRQNYSALPDTIVIRFRMRLVSGAPRGSPRTAPAVVYFARGFQMGTLFIGVGEVFLGGPNFSRDGQIAVATTDSVHTYCIESWGDAIRVSRDGRLLLTGNTYKEQSYGTSFATAGVVGWGERDPMAFGVSEWEFIEHNLSRCENGTRAPVSQQPPPVLRKEDAALQRKLFVDPTWTLWEIPDTPPEKIFRDGFDGALGEGWRWIRENPATWGLTSSHLGIALESGDLWQHWTNNAKNALIRPVGTGDFVATLRVDVYLAADINQVLILLYNDDDTYVRFGISFGHTERTVMGHAHEVQGKVLRIFNVLADSAHLLCLRVLKKGSQAQLQYSLDDRRWILHDQIEDLTFLPAYVGFAAFDGFEPPSSSFAFFDDFELREYGPEGLRAPVMEKVDVPKKSP